MNTSQLTKEEYQLIGEKLFGHNYSKKTEESSKSTSKSPYNHWLNESKKYKLSKKDKHIIEQNLLDLTEEDKEKRRRILSLIQTTNQKKNNKIKKIRDRKEKIEKSVDFLTTKDKGSEIREPSVASKIKESRKLGIWLINNGKGKQGLQYLRMCISLLEKNYEESHSRLLSEYNLYEKMREKVYFKKNSDN